MKKRQFAVEDVLRVAELARLKLTEEELERYAGQLSEILMYVEKLDTLDTSGVEPLVSASHASDLDAPVREDSAVPGPGAEAMLDPAPEKVHGGFKVPQVIHDGGA